jgi:hypothetical protein
MSLATMRLVVDPPAGSETNPSDASGASFTALSDIVTFSVAVAP